MPVIEISKDYLLDIGKKNIRIKIPNTILKKIQSKQNKKTDIMALRGSLKDWNIDPIEYQKKMRSEWDR